MKKRGKKFLLKAAEIDSGDKETYLLLCAAELYSGNLEKAEQYAQKSLSISPTDVMGHFYLGNIVSRRDDFDAAVKHYKRALEIQRTYYPAFVGLVETLEKAKRIEEAIEQYESAIREFSSFPRRFHFLREHALPQPQVGGGHQTVPQRGDRRP